MALLKRSYFGVRKIDWNWRDLCIRLTLINRICHRFEGYF